jgi:hypothetical protein
MFLSEFNLLVLIQVIVSFTILNVWLFRAEKPSKFRGSTAKNLREEFTQYGLNEKIYKTIKFVKPALAIILLSGTFIPYCTLIGASGLAFLMLGSIYMHFKVRDQFYKYLPAIILFIMCVAILILH